MPYFFYYLLKVILCSAVLFGYYHGFLRNKVYHAYNRFYLLLATAISLIVPLLNFNVLFNTDTAGTKPIQLLQAVNSSDEYMEGIVIYAQQNYLTGSQLMMLGYALVSLVMLALLVKVFIQIFTILKTNSSRTLHDVVFVQSDAKGTPFSFFKFIFWNKAIDINTPTGRQIFAHELAHVREKHSADKLFLNLLLIVYWINPIFWFIKKELNLIHEFIADKKAVADNDAGALAAMIVQSAYPKHSYLLTSHFFYSPIKRRLKMLTKYNNSKAGYLYRILALPVMLFLVAALTIKAKSGIQEIMNPEEKITVVIDAGHGGNDGGAYSPDKTIAEKQLTLALVQKIKELNTLSNINLVLTRETDIYQHPSEKVDISRKAGADLFISVHISSGPDGATNTKSGAEIYVSKDNFANSYNSKMFASSVIQAFKENYGLEVAPNPIQRTTGISVIQTDYPAILIEAGYVSNSKDLAYLQSEKGQTAFAKNVLRAIARYAASEKAEVIEISRPPHDTIPGLGTYKGERITGVMVKASTAVNKNIVLTLASGKKITLTEAEALKAGIKIPPPPPPPAAPGMPPPPPPPPPPAPPVPSVNDWQATEGSVKEITVTGYPLQQKKGVTLRGAESGLLNPLYVLNGEVISNFQLNQLDPNTIQTINVLKGETASKIYGAASALNGVIEIQTKPVVLQLTEEKKPNLSLKEVTVQGYRSNNLYIGVNNIIRVANAPAGIKLLVANGRASRENDHWIVQVPSACETSITLTTAEGKTLGTYPFTAKRLPDNFKGNLQHTLYLPDDNKVFSSVEQEAAFPGGKDNWKNFLKQHIDPAMPLNDQWEEGTYQVIVRFVVDKNGDVFDVATENFRGSKTADMCIRAIQKGPRWQPAKQNGHTVNSIRKQPINFVIAQ